METKQELRPFTETHPMYSTVQVVAEVMNREAKTEHVSNNAGGVAAEKFYDEQFAGKLSPYDLAVAIGVLLTAAQDNFVECGFLQTASRF